jgi:hypothetical protein
MPLNVGRAVERLQRVIDAHPQLGRDAPLAVHCHLVAELSRKRVLRHLLAVLPVVFDARLVHSCLHLTHVRTTPISWSDSPPGFRLMTMPLSARYVHGNSSRDDQLLAIS